MLHVELHSHTIYSKDSLTSPLSLVAAARQKGLDRLAITDHNTIQGAQRAFEIDPVLIIVGEEIMTRSGELLAFFVEHEIPPNLPAREAIQRLRAQGAFISVSHPFDRYRAGHWRIEDLLEVAPLVDAIEVFNARCWWSSFNLRAQEFARQRPILGTVGSDAHATFELGQATMLLPAFQDAESLKAALGQAKVQARLSPPCVHLVSRYAVWRKKLQPRRFAQLSEKSSKFG